MNTTNAKVQIRALTPRPPAPLADSGRRRRLVVVSSGVEQEAYLASRIWSLIQGRDFEVLLLGICRSITEEPELSRRLATLAAFLRNQEVAVEFRVESRRDWLDKLNAELTREDEIACYEEDEDSLNRPALGDLLSRSLMNPIRQLSPLESSRAARPARLKHAAAWLASILTMVGFLYLQARLINVVQGGMQTAVLLLVFFPEVGLILLWNSLLS